MPMLVATDREVVVIDVERDTFAPAHGISDRPTCLAADALVHGRLWVAIEAGALVSTIDAGRTWRDRVTGGPWDTHELAVHRHAPNTLRVSAGDGYFESDDAGATWRSPSSGLKVGYLRCIYADRRSDQRPPHVGPRVRRSRAG